jgi:hypothetical protein
MLQLTETNNGQISGVLSTVELKGDGSVTSEQAPVTGTVDADQLTLNIRSGLLSFLFGTSVAGTVKGDILRLQTMDSNGNLASHIFIHGTTGDFKAYADQLNSKGAGIALSRKLTDGAQQFQQTIRNADGWIAEAELHAQRIPVMKKRYQEIEERMKALVATERATGKLVARTQIFVTVNQGDIAGDQVDIAVNQTWDLSIDNNGTSLKTEFANWDGKCGDAAQLQKSGATPQSAEAWETACNQARAEREKFDPIFKTSCSKEPK